MIPDFTPGLQPADGSTAGYWFVFNGPRALVAESGEKGGPVSFPQMDDPAGLGLDLSRINFLGVYQGVNCFAADAEADQAPTGLAFRSVRGLYLRVEEDFFWLGGLAAHLLHWDRINTFCGRCAARMETSRKERAKVCPACGLVRYPRLSPAVIVSVIKDDKILLGRSPRFPKEMHSVLAGFVEPGETVEEAVAREIKEEVGVEVTDIRYFGSQPWPFPDSLMLGFTARYAGGELKTDGQEIVHAAWYSRDDLPGIPDKVSIARRLIDHFIESLD